MSFYLLGEQYVVGTNTKPPIPSPRLKRQEPRWYIVEWEKLNNET
jgi:hypothetical protein